MEPGHQPIKRYHVFLASPGDVREQRDFVRSFFADYNIQQGSTKGIEFQAIDWENWSTLGVGEPQKRITGQLLESHRKSLVLVVGILGQRFGTLTSTHESGTEEEFDWALDAWKENKYPEIKWFFQENDKLVLPTDPAKLAEAVDQWQKVCAFRERLKKGKSDEGNPQVHFGGFSNLDSFKEVFRRDLNIWLHLPEQPWNQEKRQTVDSSDSTFPQEESKSTSIENPSTQPFDGMVSSYLDRLREKTGRIRLAGFGQDIQVELDILEAYVPLKTVAIRYLSGDKKELVEKGTDRNEQDAPFDVNGMFLRVKDFSERGALLLGDPGAGKTTAARQLVFGLASGRKPTEELGLPPGIVPVFLQFRNLKSGEIDGKFNQFLEREICPSIESDPKRRGAIRDVVLNHKSLLWVLDGLDEIVDVTLRQQAGQQVLKLLEDRPNDYFLVTSRFQGYRGKVELGIRFVEFHVQPLEPEQSSILVYQWYRQVYRRLKGSGEIAQKEADDLSRSLLSILTSSDFSVGKMPELPKNPLLLTLVCIVHHQDRNLPKRRADLYGKCVSVLLQHWRSKMWKDQGADEFDAVSAEHVLAGAAWLMHQEQGRTSIGADQLARHIEPALRKVQTSAGLGLDGSHFLEQMRDRCGIMAMVGDGNCSFLHLTFQEYLAAVHASSNSLGSYLAAHFGETWWREVILLAMALGQSGFVKDFFEAVMRDETWNENAELLGQCLDEARFPEVEPFVNVLEGTDVNEERRLILLRLLAPRNIPELTDVARRLVHSDNTEIKSLALQITRKGKDSAESLLVPPMPAKAGAVHFDAQTGIEFVWIPAGTFVMGSEKYDREKPSHKVTLSKGFWLSQYPVTNSDYRSFVKDTAHPLPGAWGEREFNSDRQPVVAVNWEDVHAFCNWAGMRLPYEAEWEFACRAGSQSEFSFERDETWLDKYAWYGSNSGRKTHTVGQKKPNGWGLYDMHGNVWELCQDWLADYSDHSVTDPTGPKNGSRRVLRGGGWSSDAMYCRSASRLSNDPSKRDDDVGFRVVLARSSGQEQEERCGDHE